jgi:hypothetical protein
MFTAHQGRQESRGYKRRGEIERERNRVQGLIFEVKSREREKKTPRTCEVYDRTWVTQLMKASYGHVRLDR